MQEAEDAEDNNIVEAKAKAAMHTHVFSSVFMGGAALQRCG